MEALIIIVLSLLSIIGLASVIKAVVYLILHSDLTKSCCTVILLDEDDFEMTVRSAYEYSCLTYGAPARLLAIPNNISFNTLKKAEKLLKDYNIPLCKKDDIFEKLTKKGHGNERP